MHIIYYAFSGKRVKLGAPSACHFSALRAKWEEVLELVQCKVLSSCSSEAMDAYLLSESSMFVSDNRFILKTCGTTTLLYAIKAIIEVVQAWFPGAVVLVSTQCFLGIANQGGRPGLI